MTTTQQAPLMPRSQLSRIVTLAERDARQDAYTNRYLPDSRHFTSDDARQAYADVYVVAFGTALDRSES